MRLNHHSTLFQYFYSVTLSCKSWLINETKDYKPQYVCIYNILVESNLIKVLKNGFLFIV